MAEHAAVASLGTRTSSPEAPGVRSAIQRIGELFASAVSGLAVGSLLAVLAVGAYAGLNLHLATPIGDALIGLLIVALPILLVWGVVSAVAWVVRVAARLIGSRISAVARLVARVGPAVRWIRHPLAASTVVIAALFALVPEDGPLAMYRNLAPFEVPVAAAAFAGVLVGLGRGLRGAFDGRSARVAGTALPVVAFLIITTVLAWAVFPGFGDTIVHERWATLAAIAPLDLPDPSVAGPHAVTQVTYGSGNVWRRPEFDADPEWRTPTVDASAALADRDGPSAFFANLLWGHDDTTLPISGLAWYPEDSDGPMPVVLIVHGNHAAGDFSDPGYAYLGEHLASHGMLVVSVDENYLNGDAFFDYGGAEQGVRAWMLLRHLEQLATWNADPSHPLGGRLDLDRVALIGHSRGGEAVSVAAELETSEAEIRGMPPVPRGFGIRAVVGIAPSDGQYHGPGAPIRLTDVDYLVLQGAHDGDLPAFSGLATYHRVSFTGAGDHLKVALYSERANHGRFSTVWDTGDAGPLTSWLLDRGSILSPPEQQRLAKAVIGAFLQRSLFDRTEYDAFFEEPRSGREWLPDDVVLTEWASSRRLVVDDFVRGPGEGTDLQGFDDATTIDPRLRDGAAQGDRALRLTWSGPGFVTLSVPAEVASKVAPDDALVLSMVPGAEPLEEEGPIINLVLADGRERSVVLDEALGIRPLLPTRLWKVDALGARYLPGEQLRSPVERFLQTYRIPLDAFDPALTREDLASLHSIVIRFTGFGSVYLDDVAFEPG